jgi:hypothetical protein
MVWLRGWGDFPFCLLVKSDRQGVVNEVEREQKSFFLNKGRAKVINKFKQVQSKLNKIKNSTIKINMTFNYRQLKPMS